MIKINPHDLYSILDIAYKSTENVIVFGKGGFGKSSIVVDFFQKRGINPFIQSFDGSMTEERLFGGINISKFRNDGVIEYNLENSFMNHEIVIFEEFFDADISILTSIKDVLTRKIFMNGNQSFTIKTKIIVCLSNRDPRGFVKNPSYEALLQRFPFIVNLDYTIDEELIGEMVSKYTFSNNPDKDKQIKNELSLILSMRVFKTIAFSDKNIESIYQEIYNYTDVSPRSIDKVLSIIEKTKNVDALCYTYPFYIHKSFLNKLNNLIRDLYEFDISQKISDISKMDLIRISLTDDVKKIIVKVCRHYILSYDQDTGDFEGRDFKWSDDLKNIIKNFGDVLLQKNPNLIKNISKDIVTTHGIISEFNSYMSGFEFDVISSSPIIEDENKKSLIYLYEDMIKRLLINLSFVQIYEKIRYKDFDSSDFYPLVDCYIQSFIGTNSMTKNMYEKIIK